MNDALRELVETIEATSTLARSPNEEAAEAFRARDGGRFGAVLERGPGRALPPHPLVLLRETLSGDLPAALSGRTAHRRRRRDACSLRRCRA